MRKNHFSGHSRLITMCSTDFITFASLGQTDSKVDPGGPWPPGAHAPVCSLPRSVGRTCDLLLTNRIWQRRWAIQSMMKLHETVTSVRLGPVSADSPFWSGVELACGGALGPGREGRLQLAASKELRPSVSPPVKS